jgi:asparagine synthase (glutamine-hydrolysing)
LIPLPQGREQANYPVWFRTVLRPWLEDTLLSERTLSRGYYNREGIRQLIEQHMSKRYDRTIQFGLLLTFELWNRIFVDGDRP